MSDVIEYYIWNRQGLESVAEARAWTSGLGPGDGRQAPDALLEVWRGLGKRLEPGAEWRGDAQTGMAIRLLVSHGALQDFCKHTLDRRQAELGLYSLMPDLGVLFTPDGKAVDGTGRSWVPSKAPPRAPAPVQAGDAVLYPPMRVTREEMLRGLRPLMEAAGWKEGRERVWFTKKSRAGTWRLSNEGHHPRFRLRLDLTVSYPKSLRDRTDSFHFPNVDFRYSLPKALQRHGFSLALPEQQLRGYVAWSEEHARKGALPLELELRNEVFADVWRASAEVERLLRSVVLPEIEALSTPEAVCEAALLEDLLACPFESLCGPHRVGTIRFSNHHADLALLMRVDPVRAERLFRERLAIYRAQPDSGNGEFTRLANNLAELMRELGLTPDTP